MALLLCLVFGLFAAMALASGIGLLRVMGTAYYDAIPAQEREGVRRLQRRSGGIAVALSVLFAAASTLAWKSPPLGFIIGAAPFLILFALFATGHIDVISRLSTGEGEPL